MVAYVTYAEAALRLKLDTNDAQSDVELSIRACSAAIKNYLKGTMPYELVYETDTAGNPILDSSGDPIPALNSYGKQIPAEDSAGDPIVLDVVKDATLVLLAIKVRDPDGQEMEKWSLGNLPFPVTALLYQMRDPALA